MVRDHHRCMETNRQGRAGPEHAPEGRLPKRRAVASKPLFLSDPAYRARRLAELGADAEASDEAIAVQVAAEEEGRS